LKYTHDRTFCAADR